MYRDNERLESGVQLREGQTLRTETGRAELLLGIGAVLWLDEGESTKLGDAKVLPERGSALVEVTELI